MGITGKLIVRKKPDGGGLPGAHQVEREARVMAALVGTGVPCPAIHALCEDESVLGAVFYVMDYVEGRVLDMHEWARWLEKCVALRQQLKLPRIVLQKDGAQEKETNTT